MLRTSERFTPGPPPALCRCPSINPGITVRPRRSIAFVAGPASRRTAAFVPTATKRSPRIATPSAIENSGSTVTTLPLWRIRSGACA